MFDLSEIDVDDIADGFSVELPDTYAWSAVVVRDVLVIVGRS